MFQGSNLLIGAKPQRLIIESPIRCVKKQVIKYCFQCENINYWRGVNLTLNCMEIIRAKQGGDRWPAPCLKSLRSDNREYGSPGKGYKPYVAYSQLREAATSVSTASLSAISKDLSRMAMASSIWSSVMISGGVMTMVSYQGYR